MDKKQIKYLGVCVLVVTIVMTGVPIIIHLRSPRVISEITADGFLGYFGTCAAAVPTIFIAIVALWQTKKANKLSKDAIEGAKESDNIANKANEIASQALNLTEKANELSEKTNTISQKLLELEELRQDLELRPSFVITKWRAPIKNLETTCINPECLSMAI